jgi:Chromo (CHRromatin Organisation MOdifier) domain
LISNSSINIGRLKIINNLMSDNEFVVEDILEKRINPQGIKEYLVKWEGYRVSESTWEPEENLENSKEIIKDFEDRELAKKLSLQGSNAHPQKKSTLTDHMLNNDLLENPPSPQEKNEDDYQILQDFEDNIPKKIKSVKKIEDQLYSLVEWEERSDGLTPNPAYIPCISLRKINPKLLIEFYESKIKFVNKK